MKLTKDKWLHALAAMVIFLVAAFASHYWIIGVAVAMGAGLMKELCDLFLRGRFSMADLYADLCGVAVGSVIFIPIAHFIFKW
jgi:VanZ family protein